MYEVPETKLQNCIKKKHPMDTWTHIHRGVAPLA